MPGKVSRAELYLLGLETLADSIFMFLGYFAKQLKQLIRTLSLGPTENKKVQVNGPPRRPQCEEKATKLP